MTDSPPVESQPSSRRRAWAWIPSLYFAEGVPFVVVMTLAGDMYTLLGVSNDRMALYTSMLYLPWVIKPLWSPLVDVLGTQRQWIIAMQAVIAFAMAGVAMLLPTERFFFGTLAFFWIMAFSSATHDIAADGYYLGALPKRDQAWFVGIRSTFYRAAMFFVSAVLLAFAGKLREHLPNPHAWAWTFCLATVVFMAFAWYHYFILPPQSRRKDQGEASLVPRATGGEFVDSLASFFRKPGIGISLAFLLLFRFSEGQLGKLSKPFMFADPLEGGLGLSEMDVASIYGAFGIAMLTVGGIIGGIVLSKHGLSRWMLPMALAINVPNLLYLALAIWQPQDLWLIGLAVGVEQLGYGFGFAAYLLYMMRISYGEHQTAHYALCTGIMALGMMLPGMICGKIQMWLGYEGFFVWIALATIPSLFIAWLARPRSETSDTQPETAAS